MTESDGIFSPCVFRSLFDGAMEISMIQVYKYGERDDSWDASFYDL